jgi:hypothetical protein
VIVPPDAALAGLALGFFFSSFFASLPFDIVTPPINQNNSTIERKLLPYVE